MRIELSHIIKTLPILLVIVGLVSIEWLFPGIIKFLSFRPFQLLGSVAIFVLLILPFSFRTKYGELWSRSWGTNWDSGWRYMRDLVWESTSLQKRRCAYTGAIIGLAVHVGFRIGEWKPFDPEERTWILDALDSTSGITVLPAGTCYIQFPYSWSDLKALYCYDRDGRLIQMHYLKSIERSQRAVIMVSAQEPVVFRIRRELANYWWPLPFMKTDNAYVKGSEEYSYDFSQGTPSDTGINYAPPVPIGSRLGIGRIF